MKRDEMWKDPRVDAFIARLREVAPELTEEQIENIRRTATGPPIVEPWLETPRQG
ncbi:hypothetical protein [Actinophytocola oryzae]|uniref:hypothetical protein n=1 Tax=Actinophytocola oryzae TaxID=502181 RepID=UPI00141526FD|nr:hypothetical protein [Actinophytocola oryzae]